uniref:Uncharacterized protein n=1 Tax=viral metagenome TaxID=1070528 RepID=A0A6C0BZW3_9ZZZZ
MDKASACLTRFSSDGKPHLQSPDFVAGLIADCVSTSQIHVARNANEKVRRQLHSSAKLPYSGVVLYRMSEQRSSWWRSAVCYTSRYV